MAPALLEGAEGSAETAALGDGGFGELGGEAAALAVVGLGEVDEFEVEAEGAGELVGGGDVEGCGRAGGIAGGDGRRCASVGVVGFAAGDGGAAEGFDGGVEGLAGLLAEDVAEQGAEGADVAAEGSFFELAGGGLQFGQALSASLRGSRERASFDYALREGGERLPASSREAATKRVTRCRVVRGPRYFTLPCR